VAPPLRFPAARENSGKNFCSRLALHRKVFKINTLNAISRSNRRRGRETAGNPKNRRIAVRHRPINAIILINKVIISHGGYVVRILRCGKRAAVSSAPRGAEKMAGAPCLRQSPITRSAAASRRCTCLSPPYRRCSSSPSVVTTSPEPDATFGDLRAVGVPLLRAGWVGMEACDLPKWKASSSVGHGPAIRDGADGSVERRMIEPANIRPLSSRCSG